MRRRMLALRCAKMSRGEPKLVRLMTGFFSGMLQCTLVRALARLKRRYAQTWLRARYDHTVFQNRHTFQNYWGRRRSFRPPATILALVGFEVLAGCCCGTVAKRRPIFQPEKRSSDLRWHLGKIDRRYESARGGRGLSSLKPLIVVCRQVQQSSLGKLVCVLSKASTALGMRFQEIRIHHIPHSTTHSIFAQPIAISQC
jgi:hypothetical protein